MVAYACSPYRGSEPAVGWRRAVQAARRFETWVICEKEQSEPDVRRYLAEHGPLENLHFEFVPRPRPSRWLRDHSRPLFYVAYNLWHRRAYALARRLHAELRFDLTHQLTMCGYREPGYLWKLDAPFVWGPVGGTQNYPWSLVARAGGTTSVREAARTIANAVQFRFSPRVRRAARRAAVLLTANSHGQRSFRRVHGLSAMRELDVGADSVESSPGRQGGDGPLRVLWNGALIPRKALHLLLEALALLPEGCALEVRVVGSGPLDGRLKRRARRLGVDGCITWTGQIPHEDAMAQYDWADVLAFTSCRDTCGNQVLEALSRGVPVICLDHQGAGDVVTDECGFKVHVGGFRDVTQGLRDAIVAAHQDRAGLGARSQAALTRAEQFLWEAKGRRMAGFYEQALRAGVSRPRVLLYAGRYGHGTQVWIHRHATGLRRYECHVAASAYDDPGMYPHPNVHLVDSGRHLAHRLFQARHLLTHRQWPTGRRLRRAGIARLVRRLSPDLIHVHFLWNLGPAVPVAGREGLPLVVTAHGTDVNTAIVEAEYRERTLAHLEGADRVIAVSDFIAGRLVEIGCPQQKIRRIYLGAPIPDETATPGTDGGRIEVLCVGSLSETKGQGDLLEALALAAAREPRLRLTLVGDGPLRPLLERRAREPGLAGRVRLTGRVTPGQVGRFMAASHIYVQPSVRFVEGPGARMRYVHEEGLPVTLVEAISFGLPTVATRCGGMGEACRDGETGFLVEQGDAGAIAERLLELARSPDLRAEIGARGRALACAEFDARAQLARAEELYDEMLGRAEEPARGAGASPEGAAAAACGEGVTGK
jgi:glycosyltransferase involved in cell wall biosynthesis